jgi:hypothetical protein
MKSDMAPESIARLSDIMRYFVEEATKNGYRLKPSWNLSKIILRWNGSVLPHNLEVKWSFVGEIDQTLIPP